MSEAAKSFINLRRMYDEHIIQPQHRPLARAAIYRLAAQLIAGNYTCTKKEVCLREEIR